MQTFLPYASFTRTALVLDNKRLGKQRVEAKQIYNTLTGVTSGWANHPAVKMWETYESALAEYGYVICLEWRGRGFNDSLLDFFRERIGRTAYPWWLGMKHFHRSHRSNLVRKDPDYYGKMWPKIPPTLSYVWPKAPDEED